MKKFIYTLLPLLMLWGFTTVADAQIFEPEGLNMPGSWDGFVNPPNPDFLRSQNQEVGGIPGQISVITTGTRRWQTMFSVAETGADLTGGTYDFLFTSGPANNAFANTWRAITVNVNELQNYGFGGGGDNAITLVNNRFYVMNWRDSGYNPTSAIFMEFNAEPVTFESITQNPIADEVEGTDVVTVTVETSAAPAAGERIYVWYTIAGTSAVSELTFTGTTGTADIPGQADGITVSYRVITSSVELVDNQSTEYYWMRSARFSDSFTYTASANEVTDAPVLLAPANNGSGVASLASFSWETVSFATLYDVQIAADEDFTDILFNVSDLDVTSFSIPDGAGLRGETTYYWRARGTNAEGAGPWSAEWTFETEDNFRVHFNNTDNWDLVYAYAFEPGVYRGWAGEPMDGPVDGWYSYDIPESFSNVIFNNNNNAQTGNLDRNSNGWYDQASGTWFDFEPVAERDVVFSVDMSVQLASQRIEPEEAGVFVRGSFNDFNLDDQMTHLGDGIFEATVSVNNLVELYKFYFSSAESGDVWESGDDRPLLAPEVGTDTQVLETIFFDNQRGAVLRGRAGWRTLSDPTTANLSQFLGPIWTQGMSGADFTGGDPSVITLNTTNGTYSPLTTLNESYPAGAGFVVYVFDNDLHNDPSTNFWPKALPTATEEFPSPVVVSEAGGNPLLSTQPLGYAIVGNPFLSDISWDVVVAEGGLQELQNAIYIYDPNQNAEGEWVPYVNGVGALPAGGIIGAYQGFAVRSSENAVGPLDRSLTFTDAAKVEGNTGLFATPEFDGLVKLSLNYGENATSAWIKFSENGSMSFTSSDAERLAPIGHKFMTIATAKPDGSILSIADFPSHEQQLEIPLHVESTFSGTFTLTAPQFNVYHESQLQLIDTKTGSVMDLTSGLDYTFIIEGSGSSNTSNSGLSDISTMKLEAVSLQSETARFMIVAGGISTSVPTNELPKVLALSQNYPNPFNPTTQIKYDLPENGEVRLDVFNIQGQRVATLVNATQTAGTHTVTFDASSLASGVYLYRLQSGANILTKKMTLVK
ncbi:MAG: starch-binding protein [Balneolales bacterium]|nr:starch-binding protein [Balneolales bacterium]